MEPLHIKVEIPARTIVKVVVVAGVAAYFTRSLVHVIDQTIGEVNVKMKESESK